MYHSSLRDPYALILYPLLYTVNKLESPFRQVFLLPYFSPSAARGTGRGQGAIDKRPNETYLHEVVALYCGRFRKLFT